MAAKKIDHYKKLLTAISGLATVGEDWARANNEFALAVNTIALVAPQYVIEALMNFHNEIKYSNQNKSPERHDALLQKLLLAIRRDIRLSTKDNPDTFVFRLVGATPNPERTKSNISKC